jgi:hypothetical protein
MIIGVQVAKYALGERDWSTADPRPTTGRDNGANSSGQTHSEVVLVLSGAVDGIANRLHDAISIEIQPALGALAFKFGPGRHGEPLEERLGLSDTVIQPPWVSSIEFRET